MNIRKTIRKFSATLAISFVLVGGNAPALYAEDTDIYLAPPTVLRNDAPNILFIFDNSGSMESRAVDRQVTIYDKFKAHASYTGSYVSDRIYWSIDGSLPDPASGQWVSSSNNRCYNSLGSYLSAVSGNPGKYTGDVIAQWHYKKGSSTEGQWDVLEAGIDTAIDCRTDDPADATGLYLYAPSTGKSTFTFSSAYTNDSTNQFSWNDQKVTLFSGNFLNYETGTKGSYKVTRMQAAQQAMRSIINSNINVNIGMMVFNRNNSTPHGGRVVARVKGLDASWRANLHNILDNVRGFVYPDRTLGFGYGSTSNYTPLAETLYEAHQYFTGGDVVYGGNNWWGASSLTDPRPYPDICAENSTLENAGWASWYCAPYTDLKAYYKSSGVEYSVNAMHAYYDAYDASGYTTGKYISPFKYECQQGYIVIITDGDPTNDTHANTAIDAMTGGSAYETIINVPDPSDATKTITETSTTDEYISGIGRSRLDDLAGYMYNKDLLPSIDGTQRILTYTIGFADGISDGGKKLLKKTASAGHGKYYDATDPDALTQSLQSAILDIQQTTSSFAAPSLSVNAFNKLFNRDEIYFALFKPSSSTQWDGNIKKLRLCNTQDTVDYGCTFGEIIDSKNKAAIDEANLRIKDTSVSFWNTVADGGTVTDGGTGLAIKDQGPASRNLYTYLDSGTNNSYANLSATRNVVKILGDFTDPNNQLYIDATGNYALLDSSLTIASDADVQATMNWMLGYRSGTSTTAADKRWPFGDPLHSRPVALTLGAETDLLGNPDPDKPVIKLFVSTNDGQIRILNDSNGEEDWAFIPPEKLGMQYLLSQDADGKHPYGADGSPTFWVQDHNGDGVLDPAATPADRAYMFIGMRRGGRNIYAFDLLAGQATKITSPTRKLTPKLLWVIEGGKTSGFDDLGLTFSTPQVTDIRMKCTGGACDTDQDSKSKTVLIFGGGYDTSQDTGNFTGAAANNPYGTEEVGQGNAIYIVDPLDGSLIWSAGQAGSGATLELSEMIYAIPSEISLFDTDGDRATDRLFFGDMGGLIWRIDLASTLDVGVGNGSNGYVFADLVCLRDGITGARKCDTAATTLQDWRKIFYAPDIVQVRDNAFSTVPEYDAVVVSTGNRADPVDKQTIAASKEAIHNVIVVLRDYNISTGPYTGVNPPIPIDKEDVMDLTDNQLQDKSDPNYDVNVTALKGSKGWMIAMKETTGITVAPLSSPSTTIWVGEKGLAKPVVFDNVAYVTTYTPANEVTASITCASTEGLGKIYALGLYDATAVVDLDGDGTPDRTKKVGGGIPSELVTVIREGGVTGLVGTSGGAANPNIGTELPRGKTYWYEE